MLELKTTVLETPPEFHFWGGRPQTGGFRREDFEDFDRVIEMLKKDIAFESPGVNFLETGAGLSTLWFLANGFRVTSFSLPFVIENIRAFIEKNYPDLSDHWAPFAGCSEELMIPGLQREEGRVFDMALIDGNHAVPSVFSDFVAINMNLRAHGMLIIDDLQLPGPSLLAQFLEQSTAGWSQVFAARRGKWKCFKKLNDTNIVVGNMDGFKFSF